MGLERYVVDAVVLEGRSPSEIARLHGISRSWLYRLIGRYREGGYAALAPRSRRPHSCSHRTPPELEAAIVALRAELADAGHDAGPATIAHHLGRRFDTVPSPATVWRILRRHGLITPQPHKRPRSSFIRFEAALPNELWQADTTHWRLADGSDVEILNLVDDHSRLLLAADAFRTVKGADVVRTFLVATETAGVPAGLLTDNGAVLSPSTRRPPTPRRAARWSASTRPSSVTSLGRRRQARSRSFSSSSTPTGATTTRSGPTGPFAAGPRWLRSAPGSRPDRRSTGRAPTSGSARTG